MSIHSTILIHPNIIYAIIASQRFASCHKVVVVSSDMSGDRPRFKDLGEKTEAVSHQTEPGEKTQMSPNNLRPTCSEANRVISTFSFDPNLEPCLKNLHQGEASGPPESVSRTTQAPAGRQVKDPDEGYVDPVSE